MASGTATAALPLLVGAVALHGVAALGLHLWGRALVRRRGPRPWRRIAWLPVVGLALVGAAALLLRLGVFAPMTETTLAPEPGGFVAQASTAVNLTSALVVPAWLLYLASLVTLAVGSLRHTRR